MSASVLLTALVFAQTALALAACCASWRILRGPRAQDRVIGIDSLYVNIMLLLIVTGMHTTSSFFFESAMVIGILGFVATVAMAKFLLRGEVIE